MTAPTNIDGVVTIPLPQLTAEQIVISEEDLQLCLNEHHEAARFGCPGCFLLFVYAQPLVDFAHTLLTLMVKKDPNFQQGKERLAEFHSIPDKVRAHVGMGPRAKS